MEKIKQNIKQTYEYLQKKGYVIGDFGKISVKTDDKTLLSYPVNKDFEQSEITDDCHSYNVSIAFHSPYVLAVACLNDMLPCVTKQMQIAFNDTVTYEACTCKKAVLEKSEGAKCFADTLEQAVVLCEVLESAARVYVTCAPFGDAVEL